MWYPNGFHMAIKRVQLPIELLICIKNLIGENLQIKDLETTTKCYWVKSVEEAEKQYPDMVIRVLSKTESITLEACYNRVNVYINNGIIDRVVRFG